MRVKPVTVSDLRSLINTALGRVKADLVLKNANLVNVYTCEIISGIDIAVKGSRIALVGRASHTIGVNTKVIDCSNYYVVPGFLDGHVHIESSMLTPIRFSEAVIPHGTTGVFIDPHEIANVLGVKGVKYFIEESKNTPLRIFIEVPSCVPASKIDTSAATVTLSDVNELLKLNETIGLAEVMDFTGVLNCRDELLGKIISAIELGKIINGHAPSLSGRELSAYISANINSDHECILASEAIDRVRLGMYVMVREGSAWRDLSEIAKILRRSRELDLRMFLLVSDDVNCYDLIVRGHMDYIIRRAIELGVDPVKAIQMATLNTALRFKLQDDIGGIAPGKLADIVLLSDLERVKVDTVIIDGVIVAKNYRNLWSTPPKYKPPDYVFNTIKLKRPVKPEDFIIKAPITEGEIEARVIGIVPYKAVTKHLVEKVKVRNGIVVSDVKRDILKIAVVERHHRTGRIGLGLVKGFGFKYGALASSIAHDSHNIIVTGVSDSDMSIAVNTLSKCGGGIVFVGKGKVEAIVELPIAGLLSNEPPEKVAKNLVELRNVCREAGSKLEEPFMTLSILALSVIPELRITDKGLFDVVKGRIVNIFLQ